MTKKSIDAADQISKVAQKIGTTTEELSKLRYAAELTGVSQNTLDMAMQRFTRRLAEAAQGTGEAKGALEEMGISAKSMLNIPLEQRMQVLADRFKAIENPADRVRIAMKLFDSEGVSLVNTLANGSVELNKMTSEAQRLGLVIDTKTAKASEAFNDNLTRLTSKLSSVGIRIANYLVPYLVRLTDYLINFFDNIDFTYLGEFIKKLDKLAMQIVAVITALASIVTALKIYSTAMILAGKATELFNVALKNNKVVKFASWLGVLGSEANDLSGEFSDLLKEVSKVTGITIPDLTPNNSGMGAVASAIYLPERTKVDLLLKEIKDKMKNFYDDITDYGTQFADSIQNSVMGIEDAFVNFAKTGKLSFSDLADSIISDLARMAIRSTITAPLASVLGSIDFGSFFGGSSYTPYSDGWLSGARANGGQVSANSSYLVGEKGPEIFSPSSSGAIIPNNKLIGGSSGNKTIINIENNTGSNIDDTNITEMLRKNSSGEEERVINIVLNRLNTDSGFRSAFGR